MKGRPKGRYYQFIKDDVYIFVANNPGASINEVSIKCGIAWDTARRYLKILEKEGKIIHRTVGNRIKSYFNLVATKEDTE